MPRLPIDADTFTSWCVASLACMPVKFLNVCLLFLVGALYCVIRAIGRIFRFLPLFLSLLLCLGSLVECRFEPPLCRRVTAFHSHDWRLKGSEQTLRLRIVLAEMLFVLDPSLHGNETYSFKLGPRWIWVVQAMRLTNSFIVDLRALSRPMQSEKCRVDVALLVLEKNLSRLSRARGTWECAPVGSRVWSESWSLRHSL